MQEDDDRGGDDYQRRRDGRNSFSAATTSSSSSKGRWNDSIPNNILLVRGLPEDAIESDVCLIVFSMHFHYLNQVFNGLFVNFAIFSLDVLSPCSGGKRN